VAFVYARQVQFVEFLTGQIGKPFPQARFKKPLAEFSQLKSLAQPLFRRHALKDADIYAMRRDAGGCCCCFAFHGLSCFVGAGKPALTLFTGCGDTEEHEDNGGDLFGHAIPQRIMNAEFRILNVGLSGLRFNLQYSIFPAPT
jgi:hypothetical protein